jgi:hypothetical protein
MRDRRFLLIAAAALVRALATTDTSAQTFNSGSTGADGAFSPTVNTTLTLPASGVLNFTTVNIPSGVTVKFSRNATNTPVTILATGNVTISGIIDVRGAAGVLLTSGTSLGTTGGAAGPGGFDGGNGANGTVSTTGGTGRGPGGGTGGTGQAGGAGGAGFVVAGNNGGAAPPNTAGTGGGPYGDPTLLPLIGGSGGGGGGATFGSTGGGGGGGGGAILIASSGTITLSGASGQILANGGSTGCCFGGAPGGGSGGAVRLVATTVSGSGGTINVAGGPQNSTGSNVGGAGSPGRVRVEGFTNTLAATVTGSGASVSSAPPTSVTLANSPIIQITGIGGVNAPANPTGSLTSPDVVLPGTTTNPVTVSLGATNVPIGTTILVTVVGYIGPSSSAVSTPLSGTLASSTATVTVTLPTNEAAVISASAVFSVAALDGQGLYYADGEPVDRVRITTVSGGRRALTFITRSGREVTVSAR